MSGLAGPDGRLKVVRPQQRRGVDAVLAQNGACKRRTDFGQGERLGVRDHLIVLTKPQKKPDWMGQYEYDQAPSTLKVREFQAGGKILVTTFVCPKENPKNVLKALYRCRWNVELDLRNINPIVAKNLRVLEVRCRVP